MKALYKCVSLIIAAVLSGCAPAVLDRPLPENGTDLNRFPREYRGIFARDEVWLRAAGFKYDETQVPGAIIVKESVFYLVYDGLILKYELQKWNGKCRNGRGAYARDAGDGWLAVNIEYVDASDESKCYYALVLSKLKGRDTMYCMMPVMGRVGEFTDTFAFGKINVSDKVKCAPGMGVLWLSPDAEESLKEWVKEGISVGVVSPADGFIGFMKTKGGAEAREMEYKVRAGALYDILESFEGYTNLMGDEVKSVYNELKKYVINDVVKTAEHEDESEDEKEEFISVAVVRYYRLK